uniref:Uncharacterized protein n=1 Tax=Plectus sambesii TaxID=2011161 RepID=A0A914UNG1_9BILA
MQAESDIVISPFERRVRWVLETAYRWVIAAIISSLWFDFLFSSIWMHGYIWSLNQKYEVDMSDRSAGHIVDHQRNLLPMNDRFVYCCLFVVAVWLTMIAAGFRSSFNIWQHFKLSASLGTIAGLIRCLQMKQRIYPAIHEGFYVYLMVFVIGIILTAR